MPLKTSAIFTMIPSACNQSSSKTITYRLKASINATVQSGFKYNLSKRARSSGEALNTISVAVAIFRSSQSFHFKKKLERIHIQSPWLYDVPRGSAILGFLPFGLSTVTSLHRKLNQEAVFFINLVPPPGWGDSSKCQFSLDSAKGKVGDYAPKRKFFQRKGSRRIGGWGVATYYVSFVQIMRQKSVSPIAVFVTGNRMGFHNAEKCFVGPLLSRKLVGREVQIFQFIVG